MSGSNKVGDHNHDHNQNYQDHGDDDDDGDNDDDYNIMWGESSSYIFLLVEYTEPQ